MLMIERKVFLLSDLLKKKLITCKSFLDKLFKGLLFLNILVLSMTNNITLEKYFRPS